MLEGLSEKEASMRIEEWSICANPADAYVPPELRTKTLHGKVFGHPRFEDGHEVTTSAICGVKDGQIVTTSGSLYELGEPDAKYEAAFPGARLRALGLPSNVTSTTCENGTHQD